MLAKCSAFFRLRAKITSKIALAALAASVSFSGAQAEERFAMLGAQGITPAALNAGQGRGSDLGGVDRAGAWGSSGRAFSMRLSEAVFHAVNRERQKRGFAPVAPNAPLSGLAARYSAQMIAGDFFGHYSPDGKDLESRLGAHGLTQFEEVAENLWNAEGRINWFVQENVDRAIEDWLNSNKGHREAMLDPNLKVAGVGAALRDGRITVAMLFGR